MSEDDAVRATNDDAAGCKRTAVYQGYWRDPYIQYFIRAGDRKVPEINRGYFARVQGIKLLLKQFLEVTKCNCQVINLGAGFDTTYWNLKDEGLAPKNYVEVDFEGVTSKKNYYIKSRKPLLEHLTTEDGDIQFSKTDLHAAAYHVVSADMRDVTQLAHKLSECQIDKSLPTAFMAECVLVYMPSENSTAVVKWITENFPSAFFINYEQVNMSDRFGQVMMDNLHARGCGLLGVSHCLSLDTQRARFLDTGWEGAMAMDMLNVYRCLPQAEVQRIEKLEFLDDREMFDQLLSHYCICWAHTGGAGEAVRGIRL